MHDLEEVQRLSAMRTVSPSLQMTRRSYSGDQPASLSGLRVGFSFGQGRYRLGELLGYGGTCVVHDVRDLWLDRLLAGKIMIVDHASVAVHARLEACATARLRHPNIIELIDFLTRKSQCPVELVVMVCADPKFTDGAPVARP